MQNERFDMNMFVQYQWKIKLFLAQQKYMYSHI